jgi:hypothetical protein
VANTTPRSIKGAAAQIAAKLGSRRLRRAVRHATAARFRRTSAGRLAAREGFDATLVGGQWVAVRTQGAPTAAMAFAHNYQIVRDVLEAAGVPLALVSQHPMRRHVVAIRGTDWAKALAALAQGADTAALYATLPAQSGGRSRPAKATFTGSEQFACGAASLLELPIYEVGRQTLTTRVHAGDYACMLQRWDESADGGVWNAPASNETATFVAGDAFTSVREATDPFGTREVRFDAAPEPYQGVVNFPIDLVYLWVDGNSPQWQASRKEHAELNAPASDGGDAWLFRDRDELLYSMRSVEQFAPWVHRIHLVTADQVPRWLNLDSDRVTLHSHSDMFADPGALPTFNSHAIGSQLHRIPGLSEHYVIMNDDIFFGAPVEPEEFFTPAGLPRIMRSALHAPLADGPALNTIEHARKNSANLMKEKFGVQPTQLFAHTPIPQLKSFAQELEHEFPEVFASTAHSKFRSDSDYEINAWLHLNALELSGRAARAQIRFRYFYLSSAKARKSLERALRSSRASVLCLNDGPPQDNVDYDEWLTQQLADAYPVTSSVELPPEDWRRDNARG